MAMLLFWNDVASQLANASGPGLRPAGVTGVQAWRRPHDETRKGRPPARPGMIPAGKFITNLKHDSLLVLPHATGSLGASGPAPGRLSRPRAGGVDQARRMAAKTAAAVTVPLIV
jgi:hypothetical protein